MGNGLEKEKENATHKVIITTGDKKGAAAHWVNVHMTLTDWSGHSEKVTITDKFEHQFHTGSTDEFYLELPGPLGKITKINISRDESGKSDEWYVDRIEVDQICKNKEDAQTCDKDVIEERSVFPVHRWISADSTLSLVEYDSVLPQNDTQMAQRQKELRMKREQYTLSGKILGAPPQLEILPDTEKFTNDYQWDISRTLVGMRAKTAFVDLTTPNFSSLHDMESVYQGILPVPKGIQQWRCDVEFGNQKLAGCNPVLIQLCKVIPEHMAVTPNMIEPHLEGKSVEDALEKKKLYIIDLRYMADIECSFDRKLPGPTCLLYVRDSSDLVPIAIQLMPDPADDNPVFTPSDPEYTWLAAKMWFNLADCSHHQSVTHLGFTHLLIEAVATCTHRRLSPSHPMFKLLAPHFIYLLAINSLAITALVGPGEWVDRAMHIGRTGMFNIIKENWAEWDLKKDGNLLKNFEERGVDDVEALPNYHYRDDARLLWDAISKYVSTVVNQVYDSKDKLSEDTEIHAWCKELANDGKFNGLPQKLSANEELIEMVTVFIYISSVGHAAANFGQYDEYAFPPNYPASLHVDRPTSKAALNEDYIVDALPPKKQALDVMLITKVLSERGTNELGNFEVQYAYDPISMDALARFKADLKEISVTIDERNTRRARQYIYLNPREVPNAISI